MKAKLSIITLIIFGTFFNHAYADFYINPGFGAIHFVNNGNVTYTAWGTYDNWVRPSNPVTGNGDTDFDLYDLDYNYLTTINRTVYGWNADPTPPEPEPNTFPASATSGIIEDFQRILFDNLNLILLFTSGIMVWILLKKWIFGGTKRI